MKAKIKNGKKKFDPIKLKITIESYDELCELYHRFLWNDLYGNINTDQAGYNYPKLHCKEIHEIIRTKIKELTGSSICQK